MGEPAIAVRGLRKAYGRKVAVDDLSFEVEPGTVTAFLGPNGAGKSTTMRILLGLAPADQGEATILGRPYRRLERPATVVGALIDGAGFHPKRTARQHLRVLAAAAGLPDQRVEDVLAAVELEGDADRRVGGYSLGMRRRLGLAAALLGRPRVLVLDEPSNGLDPPGIRWLRETLRTFAADGGTVFVSSHVLGEVANTADHVVVVHRGRLVTQTGVGQLTAGGLVTVRSSDPERLRRALVGGGGRVQPAADGRMAVGGLTLEDVGWTAAREGVALFELFTKDQSLEDVFLQLVDEGKEAVHVAS